jgi:DNA-binding CsgD family transcriptional regulator
MARHKQNEIVSLKFQDGNTGSLTYREVCAIARERISSDPDSSKEICEDLGLNPATIGAIKANLNRS